MLRSLLAPLARLVLWAAALLDTDDTGIRFERAPELLGGPVPTWVQGYRHDRGADWDIHEAVTR